MLDIYNTPIRVYMYLINSISTHINDRFTGVEHIYQNPNEHTSIYKPVGNVHTKSHIFSCIEMGAVSSVGGALEIIVHIRVMGSSSPGWNCWCVS